MKKILMSLLVLWATGAFAQEIRMPEEKRKDYVEERAPTTVSEAEQMNEAEERRRKAAIARRRAQYGQMKQVSSSSDKVYCTVHELASVNGRTKEVRILTPENLSKYISKADKEVQQQIGTAVQKVRYPTALDALSALSGDGWVVESTNVVMNPDMLLREYLLVYYLPPAKQEKK